MSAVPRSPMVIFSQKSSYGTHSPTARRVSFAAIFSGSIMEAKRENEKEPVEMMDGRSVTLDHQTRFVSINRLRCLQYRITVLRLRSHQ